jgi:hypothetical protein
MMTISFGHYTNPINKTIIVDKELLGCVGLVIGNGISIEMIVFQYHF